MPLVAEFEEVYKYGPHTWIRKPGDVLNGQMYPDHVVADIRKRLGEVNFAAQYQQNPSAAPGELIKDEHIHRFQLAQFRVEGRQLTLTIDTALKQGEDASYTAALVIATEGRFHYVIDVLRGRFEFAELRDAILRLLTRYRIGKTLIEDSSAGPSLKSVLAEKGRSSELWPTRGRSKQERLGDHMHLFVDGRIWLAGDQPWSVELVNELLRFPNGRHDDQVDALSQYLAWINTKGGAATPIVLGANSSEARMVRAFSGPQPARGVHPMRNPNLRIRRW